MAVDGKGDWRPKWIIAALLIALVLAVYSRTWAADFDFINMDDDFYVTANSHVQAGLTAESVGWAFTSFDDAVNWHPLTWLSLELDAQLFGINAQAFHATNVLLHAANTALLFGLLLRLTGALWCSAITAAFFGVHPAHVEAVAWVTSRKDVLSTLFWLLATAAYAWYAERPACGRYLLLTLLFILGLLAKSMPVTLPCTLLLLDYWPLRRWPNVAQDPSRYRPSSLRRLVLEKLPLMALAIPVMIATLRAQQTIIGTLAEYPMGERIGNALVSYGRYVLMAFWPVDLALLYPHPHSALPLWQPIAAGVFLLGVTVAVVCDRGQRRYLVVGWLWLIGTMVPVIGLVQNGTQALADRYTYVPYIGLFMLLIWGAADWCARDQRRASGAALVAASALAWCLLLTWWQIDYWRNSEALWRHALAATRNHGGAHAMLGMALSDKGELPEAVEQFQASLQLAPDNPATHGNLAIALASLGQLDQAAEHLEASLRLRPDAAKTHFNLAQVRARQGRYREAIEHFTAALERAPELVPAGIGLADTYVRLGQRARARQLLDGLLERHPESALLHLERGRLLKREGRVTEAVAAFDRALDLEPEYAEVWNQKGLALEALARPVEAAACFEHAAQRAPGHIGYRLNLAHVQRARGDERSADEHYALAFQLDGNWPHVLLAQAWLQATDADAARRDGAQALRSATLVCEATSYQMPHALDVLAAAYAELGEFKEAAAWQRKLLEQLPSQAPPQIKRAVAERLALYEHGQPYREHVSAGDGK